MTSNTSGEPTPQNHGEVGHNSGKGDRSAVSMIRMLPDEIVMWGPAAEQAHDVDLATIEGEVDILKDAGQRATVTARRREDGRIEVVAKGYLVRAIKLHNELHPTAPLEMEVRVFDTMSDDAAFRTLVQDVEQGPEASSLARGRYYASAVKHFGSEANAAKSLRVAKATISKNLDTTRCLTFVAEKVQVHRDISQRDAMWLMQIVGRKKNGSDAPDQERRKLIIDTVDSMKVMPARKVFATLRAALKASEPDKPRKAVTALSYAGREIGTMRRGRIGGPITFSIADAGDIELDQVIDVVREALAQTRR